MTPIPTRTMTTFVINPYNTTLDISPNSNRKHHSKTYEVLKAEDHVTGVKVEFDTFQK